MRTEAHTLTNLRHLLIRFAEKKTRSWRRPSSPMPTTAQYLFTSRLSLFLYSFSCGAFSTRSTKLKFLLCAVNLPGTSCFGTGRLRGLAILGYRCDHSTSGASLNDKVVTKQFQTHDKQRKRMMKIRNKEFSPPQGQETRTPNLS